MEKTQPWQRYLILGVIVLTIYNILPTIFYYAHPLRDPISPAQAQNIAGDICARVNDLEDESLRYVRAYAKHLGAKTENIAIDPKDHSKILVDFQNKDAASQFSYWLPKAAAHLPFFPAQLDVTQGLTLPENRVVVSRKIATLLSPQEPLFTYYSKNELASIVRDRAENVEQLLQGGQRISVLAARALDDENFRPSLIELCGMLRSAQTYLAADKDLEQRTLSLLLAGVPSQKSGEKEAQLTLLLGRMRDVIQALKDESLSMEVDEKEDQSDFLSTEQLKRMAQIAKERANAEIALLMLESHKKSVLAPSDRQNPFFAPLEIDFANERLHIPLHASVRALLEKRGSEEDSLRADELNKAMWAQVAKVSTVEELVPDASGFYIPLYKLSDVQGALVLDMSVLAKQQQTDTLQALLNQWHPQSDEFTNENFSKMTGQEFALSQGAKRDLGLVVSSPVLQEAFGQSQYLRNDSLYVVAKGLAKLLRYYQKHTQSSQAKIFMSDIDALRSLAESLGFRTIFPGDLLPDTKDFVDDIIFENRRFFAPLLTATREDFRVLGTGRFAVLELSTYEQRLLTQNKIDNAIHDELLKWRDDYASSKVSVEKDAHLLVLAPTKNPYIENFKLSFKKYFRGDDRKTLKWGLDLSGGKTITLALKDATGRPVSDAQDLRTAINELTQRVNKMGVSEVSVRAEGKNIVMDFPGSQGVSASELVEASAMYFHVVNEQFSPNNEALASAVTVFLQEVWNEALVLKRTNPEAVNEIAWRHLGGSDTSSDVFPKTEHAKLLYENGLRLHPPFVYASKTSAYDDTVSELALLRNVEGQNPLIFVFRNFALEGSSLENVSTGYDTSDGYQLYFGVKGSAQDAFYAWTKQFSQDQIAGTMKESLSRGRGWRMAVVLNGSVISAPTLHSALSHGGTVSGNFTQREINALAGDLRAGSLSFTPEILSEKNVSAELGALEKSKGILAACLGLIFVVVAMIGVYRFAGAVASVAVLFNLLIMWGILQNLGAALTLPGIAGIVLTIGMAVDANVLVFERFREEFELSKRLGAAMHVAYKKAFAAIVDSNVTTVIAAYILIQFDSGPIKGFAVVLIVGIVSSMFSALFMTKYYFSHWLAKHRKDSSVTLTMVKVLPNLKHNFLAKFPLALAVSSVIVLCGLFAAFEKGQSFIGMDFTGGYAVTISFEPQPELDIRATVTQVLKEKGLLSGDFQVRELNNSEQLRIQLGHSLELSGKPFSGLALEQDDQNVRFAYEKNPRLVWLVEALQESALTIHPTSLERLHLDWTQISGQLSETMRNNAIYGLFLSLLGILIYITIRFEFKYAMGAILCTAHDVLLTLAFMLIFHFFGLGLQLDLQAIGALMTIIGYSLNDTIIVFDRIREDKRLFPKWPFVDVINQAINVTLGRTVMTSGTTLLVLLALVAFGGGLINGFALVMSLGVVIGTLSSLYVAAPCMLYFHKGAENGSERPSENRHNPVKVG